MRIDRDLEKIILKGNSVFKNPELKLYPYVSEQLIRFLNKPDENVAELTFKRLLNFYKKFDITTIFIKNLNIYEKKIGSLLPSYRTHYIHVIYVFIIGICIYISNSSLRRIFYKEGHFLYFWTISALLHDIGYSVELASQIVNASFDTLFILLNNKLEKRIGICLDNKELNWLFKIDEQFKVKIFDEFIKDLIPGIRDDRKINLFSKSLKINFKNELNICYANHGTIGSIVVTKSFWESYMNRGEKAIPIYRNYVIKSSAAIFFHTNFNIILNLKKLKNISVNESPLSYLLFLSDELQEWNRHNIYNIDKEEHEKILKSENRKYKIKLKDGKIIYTLPAIKADKIKKKLSILKDWRKFINLKTV